MSTPDSIQWFPGHMARTRRKMAEILPLIDLVTEIRDARIPYSSHNPELDTMTRGKPRICLLNKTDIADEAATRQWLTRLEEGGAAALPIDCRTGRGVGAYVPLVRQVLAPQMERWKAKGMVSRPLHILVAGIPNSGKSSFINRLSKGGKARVEDRPGVTRGNQWFSVEGGLLLLDTPGVLWPKFEDQTVARHLAYTGAIRDQILDCEELACGLLLLLARDYAPLLQKRYRLSAEELAVPEADPFGGWELLQAVGRRRGMLISGGEVDTERAAVMLLDEFRGGKLGRITLERLSPERT
ncbi:MAG: ribosome biogenesis GTPase YlqF [Clostridiales bacterium]|nr:ribosome biogenesis GTPase YlqF [Clostridiales bacterium]